LRETEGEGHRDQSRDEVSCMALLET
jgi:hypothetical protein